jgi:hypothetical protein
MEENRIPKRILYMNLETRRPRNRWQDEVMEDGRMVGGEEWREKVYDSTTFFPSSILHLMYRDVSSSLPSFPSCSVMSTSATSVRVKHR